MKTSTSARSPLSPTLWPPEAFPWWGSLGLGLLLFLVAVIPPTIFFTVLVVLHMATLEDVKSFTWPVLAGQFVSYAAALAVLVALLPRLAHRPLTALGLRTPHAGDVAWGIGGAIAMIMIATATGALQDAVFHVKADEVQVQWLRDARGSLVAAFVLLACLAAPFFEELTFRGFVFNALLRHMPAWLAVLLSAILFGFVHWQPGNAGAIAPLAAGGIVLATVYYRSGSLIASMTTHALFNLVTVVLVLVFHQV